MSKRIPPVVYSQLITAVVATIELQPEPVVAESYVLEAALTEQLSTSEVSMVFMLLSERKQLLIRHIYPALYSAIVN